MISYRPERADEVVGVETPSERADALARAARVRERRRRSRGADVPRSGRHARDRRRRGGRAPAARGRPVHASDAAGDVRCADPDPAAAAPRREHAGRPRARRDVHAVAAARRSRPEGVEARRADLDRALDPPHAAPAQPRRCGPPQRRARVRGHRASSRWRASTSRTATCRTSRRTSAGIVEGGWQRAKGLVEALYAALKAETVFERTADDLLHPGKAASVGAGIVGELHPAVARRRLGRLRARPRRVAGGARTTTCATQDVITYPAVRQDLAFSVPEDVAAGDLVAAAHEAAGPELREMRAFDVYRGGQVGEGRKSIAFSVSFQSRSGRSRTRMRQRFERRSSKRSRRASEPNSERSRRHSLGQRLHNLALDLRRVIQQALEVPLCDDERTNGRRRFHGRRARRVVDERDLAEEVAPLSEFTFRLFFSTSAVPSIRTKNSRPGAPWRVSSLPSLRSISSAMPLISRQLLLRALGEQRCPLEKLCFRVFAEPHADEFKAMEWVRRRLVERRRQCCDCYLLRPSSAPSCCRCRRAGRPVSRS